jgi:magnesium-protoporphyrin O-methyltransferase
MPAMTYEKRRGELEHYFDRTAAAAWAKLTSDAPVSGIRATVRAGRDEMRTTILSYLPQDLRGRRVLDAGCGTGALAVEAARRGAEVVASDLSATLVGLARERLPHDLGQGRVTFHVGDMTDPTLGTFDHVVAMDSIIHYRGPDMVRVVAGLAARARHSVIFTFAPLTPLLAVALTVGKLVPRGDKSPAIEPIRRSNLWQRIARHEHLAGWQPARAHKVSRGFYISNAVELVRA